ncbi:MAG: discoidin domain-containing protein, partial [Gammaproteobacteria bacterium]|nr:discoidin domain-containing protein [Gammaproteobacteria bacterium]
MYSTGGRGGRLVSVSSEHNSTSWAGSNLNDGDPRSRWLSRQNHNTLEYQFDRDWDGVDDDAVNIEAFQLYNYGAHNRAVEKFQIAVSSDGSSWSKLEVPGTAAGESGFNFAFADEGGILDAYSYQHNSSSWAAANLHDGSLTSYWLSNRGNNTLDFSFDPDASGSSGQAGDQFTLEGIRLYNYGEHNRALQDFQLEVKSATAPDWTKVENPLAVADDFNFALSHEGGVLDSYSDQHNTTSWAAANIHDGDFNTYWLSRYGNSTLDFSFDPDGSGSSGEVDDQFTLEKVALYNYGNHNRAIRDFQILIKTATNSSWSRLVNPLAVADGFNFALSHEGGVLDAYSYQHNSSSWAAANIHDGDPNSYWLSNRRISNLDFSFDPDGDGSSGGVADRFTLEEVVLYNYGAHNRAIQQFQLEVKTASAPVWTKLANSNASANDFNYALSFHGGALDAYTHQHNSSNWAAANLHDGDSRTYWLSNRSNNQLDFSFDPDNSGVTAEVGDQFTLDKVILENYGAHNRSIREFRLLVKTATEPQWTPLPLPGSGSGDSGYNFLLSHNGGIIDSYSYQHNGNSWAAKNINDGDERTIWLSRYPGNSLEFSFDYDGDGSDDGVNLDKIELLNYGNHNRSVQDFELDIQIANGGWQGVEAPGGGTLFTAARSNALQSWSVGPFNDVTQVRLRTLSNYGDRYTGVAELKLSGDSLGSSYNFTALRQAGPQAFDVEDIPAVTALRLQTISNYGDSSTGATELQVVGENSRTQYTFTAARSGTPEIFDVADTPEVTALRLQTISNYGDGYIGARELQAIGRNPLPQHTFTATKSSGVQEFDLPDSDEITALRLQTINNYGDDYIGAQEFQVIGSNDGLKHLFTAARSSSAQEFAIDDIDAVTAVRLRTINNYGDSYTGARELEILGRAVGASHTFIAPRETGPHSYTLDAEDQVSGITAARFITINNYGDSYIGAAELQLLGSGVGADYLFSAERSAALQSFSFDPTQSKLFRLHTLSNYGDTYTGAAEISLNATTTESCKYAKTCIALPLVAAALGGEKIEIDGSGVMVNGETVTEGE